MYGYVRPLKGELRVAEYEAYRAAYCGLCRELGKTCGFRTRFLVSYDLTFLYCLLSAGQKTPETARCRCPADPLRRKICLCGGEAMRMTALVSVLLACHRLRDTAADERGFRRLAARLGLLFYRRAYRLAADSLQPLDALMQSQLAQLAGLEAAGCTSIDRAADAFAGLLAGCAALEPDPVRTRILRELLYHVGRFIYLVDALDDLSRDLTRGTYNPLAGRYRVQDGALSAQDEQALADTIELSLARAAAALELLEPQWSGGILRNIIYLGLPAVLESVRAGTFENHQLRRGVRYEGSI